jgi:acetyltransferase-like isoleucine patch superfamily enzyme
MEDYCKLFKSCGENVVVEANVHIEHPELFEVGNNVRIASGFYCQDSPQVTLSDNVAFFPNCFIQGNGELTVAHKVTFYPNTYFSTASGNAFIRVGHTSHFAPGCALYGGGGLQIGPYCNIAAHVVLATVQHSPLIHEGKPMAIAPGSSGPITLEEDIWIGTNASVTPNTFVAKGCIIGANAVVTRDTEPFGLYVGVPAKRLRDRLPAGEENSK